MRHSYILRVLDEGSRSWRTIWAGEFRWQAEQEYQAAINKHTTRQAIRLVRASEEQIYHQHGSVSENAVGSK